MRSAGTERPITQIRFDGGRPCLDFVNTIHDRYTTHPEDYLTTPQRYREWCVRARLLDENEALQVDVTASALQEARTFRERLYAVFVARIRGAPAPSSAIAELDRWLHRAWSDLILDFESAQCLSWRARAIDEHLPVKRIALSALELLRDGQLHRLRQCATPDSCGWLFYDDTKNARRRWCAMATCGTSAKMREYRAR